MLIEGAGPLIGLFLLAACADGCRTAAPKSGAAIPVRVAEVRLDGFEVLPAYVVQTLRDRIPLKPGAPLTDPDEQATGNLAVETLQNHGFPYAAVRIAREPAGAAAMRILVNAVPGNVGFFGRTDIVGNRRVADPIIRSRLAFSPGELFRRSALEQSRQNLAALELFKSVSIAAQQIDRQPVEVPIAITVTEQSPWRWNLSLGYAGGEDLGVEARVGNMNFLGGARRIELSGRISKIDHLVEVAFTQPQLLSPRVTLSLLARDWGIDEAALYAVSRGGQAALTFAQSPQFSTTVGYAASRERSRLPEGLDALSGLQDGGLSAWSIELDRRPLTGLGGVPSGQGWLLHLEQAGGWMPGRYNYYQAVGEVREYHTRRGGRITLAAEGRIGSISPMHQKSDVPLSKRFFLGGSGQMRGWSRFEVGPLSPSGDPIGGNSLMAATAEIRGRLLSKLRGALFVEAGNVWAGAWTAHLDDLKFDAGPGLRVETPFGLIRVDVGYQLNRVENLRVDGQPERRRWRINIGIGEAF